MLQPHFRSWQNVDQDDGQVGNVDGCGGGRLKLGRARLQLGYFRTLWARVVSSWWGTANAAWLTWCWQAWGRLGTSWSCEEPPSCIVFEGCCRFCCEALNAALLVGLVGERSGMLSNKPGASLCPEHWGPMASAICWCSWRMRINVLGTVLVHSVAFKNPFSQDSPCSSGDKITCQGQKN